MRVPNTQRGFRDGLSRRPSGLHRAHALHRAGVIGSLAAFALVATACSSTSTPAASSSSAAASSAASPSAAGSSAAGSSAAGSSAAGPRLPVPSGSRGSSSAAGSSAAGSATAGSGNAATATSAAALGGMSGLVAAANKEGAAQRHRAATRLVGLRRSDRRLPGQVPEHQAQFHAAGYLERGRNRRSEDGQRYRPGPRRLRHRFRGRAGEHRGLRPVQGRGVERHPGYEQGADGALLQRLHRGHGCRLQQ